MDVSPGTEAPLRFGSFELDPRSRELRRGSTRIRLQEQPFEILRMMLERPGDVVTRDELRRRLWPEGTFVDFEHSLNAAVKRLRAALGDDADNPQFVQTLPRRGYRFIGTLTMELAADEGTAPAPTMATSISAYQAYLKGRYHWNAWLKPDDPGLEEALQHYTEALRIDPRFAPAHAGTARAHIARAVYYRERPRSALETARNAAKRALELDPGLSEGHLALADVRRLLEWDWRGAEAAYAKAISLNPSLENSHRGYGTMLVTLSRYSEAVRHSERACELDPFCLVVGTSAAWVRYLSGDLDAAIAHCRRTIDLDPQYVPARRILGAIYLQAGKIRDAVIELEAAYGEARQDPVFIASYAHARAAAGDHGGAIDLLAQLQRLDRKRYIPPYHVALAHVGLGDADSAFAALEKAVVDCDPALANLAVEPRFEPIRADSRYDRLIDLLGL